MGDPMHDYEQHEVKRFTSGENNEDTDDIAIQVKGRHNEKSSLA